MKPKHRTVALFPSKPKANQGRTSLLRLKEDMKRRSLCVLLSPLPHCSPFKSPRTSITNFTPKQSGAYKRGIPHDGSKATNQQIEKLLQHVSSPKIKKQRKNTKRKNEADKLREDLLSKKYIADGNLFGSKRALRSRLILTPKSPLVRVKRTARQNVKSRKISLNSLNKFLSRDVIVELEKLPCDEIQLVKEVSRAGLEESVRVDENDRRSPVRIPPVRDITILLEKLSPSITQRRERQEVDEVPSTSTVVSDEESPLESPPNDMQTFRIPFDPSKHAPLREIRILLDKLPDTDSASEPETTHSIEPETVHVEVSQPDDMVMDTSLESLEKLHETVVDQSIDKSSRKEPSTPSQQPVPDQLTVDTESLSTQITTPAPEQAETSEMSAKKTPKSLDIPLRRISIAKSKFTKMNRALENPVSPARIRPHSAFLSSPLSKLKSWKSQTTTPAPITESTSSSESSALDTVSSSSSTLGNVASGETSRSSIASTSSSHSQKVQSSVAKPRSDIDQTGVLSRTKRSTSKYTGSKSIHSSDGRGGGSTKPSNKTKLPVTKEIPKTSAAITEKEKSNPLPPAKSPTSVQSVPLCTEVGSPMSRGQLLTAKSLAASPNVLKMPLKSPSRSRSSKSEKPYAKSPLNRGRLMTEQSLASSPSSGAEKSRSSSAGSSLHRSLSNVTSSSKERKDVPYKQKWSSAGDLLKISTTDIESDSSNDLSSVAIPLDPTPAPGVFSNSKTCSAILSTLGAADRNKSKSEPQKLSQWSTSELAKSTSTLPKKTPDSSKTQTAAIPSVSRSQPDLSEKLAGVRIDSTKPSHTSTSQSTSIQKKSFHIPKVVPGVSGFYKTPVRHPSSLPHSGFTPSPPTKSMVTRPVLDMGASMYPSTSYATTNSRQLPVKSSQPPRTKPSTATSCFKTPLAKPYYSTSSHSSTLKPYTSLLQTATPKPPSTSNSQSSTITKPAYLSRPLPVASKLPHTPASHPSSTVPPYTPIPPTSSTKPYTLTTTKPQQSSSSHVTFAKPLTPVSYTPPVKPSYVPSSQLTKTPSSTSTPSKTHIPIKPVSATKPLKSDTSSGQSSHKSKPRPFKTAYMSARSSNSDSFSKCLPSGPQYSPTYSKYLQNGFSYLPAAQYKMPRPAKPLSPGTKEVLKCPTIKPWIYKKPVSPPSGPSGSLTSSKLTCNPSFSPLCPEF